MAKEQQPNAPVTSAQVVEYISAIVVAERGRLAQIMAEMGSNPESMAEAIANSWLNPETFEWPG